jgi:hypothetical protein
LEAFSVRGFCPAVEDDAFVCDNRGRAWPGEQDGDYGKDVTCEWSAGENEAQRDEWQVDECMPWPIA